MKLKIFKLAAITLTVMSVGVLPMGCSDDFKSPDPVTGTTLKDAIESNTELEILEAALIKTGLINIYGNVNTGSHTFFAPNDAAFLTYLQGVFNASTPPTNEAEAIAKIEALTTTSTPLNLSTLISRLNYHILGSDLPSGEVTGSQTFTTLQGGRLSVSLVSPDILLNANTGSTGSKVVTTDDTPVNGSLYIIDKVMALPGGGATVIAPFNLTVSYATSPPTIGGTGGSETGGDTNGNDFDIMSYAIRRSGLATTLVPNTTTLPDFTIFAPTDNAFRTYLGDNAAATAALENAAIATLKAMSEADLANLLKYHIVAGRNLSTDLQEGKVLNTLLTSESITVSVDAAVITLEDGNAAADPTVTTVNNINTNGVVHTINGVLRPN
jgi:uncharacterized surface protein with fasciclin (FAS1) repeats